MLDLSVPNCRFCPFATRGRAKTAFSIVLQLYGASVQLALSFVKPPFSPKQRLFNLRTNSSSLITLVPSGEQQKGNTPAFMLSLFPENGN
jgi:hypothetical protein